MKHSAYIHCPYAENSTNARSPHTVNQQILAAIKFGVSQNKVIWRLLNLASPLSMQCTIDVTYVCWRRQILAKIPNSPNIIARQNLFIYSNWIVCSWLTTVQTHLQCANLEKLGPHCQTDLMVYLFHGHTDTQLLGV